MGEGGYVGFALVSSVVIITVGNLEEVGGSANVVGRSVVVVGASESRLVGLYVVGAVESSTLSMLSNGVGLGVLLSSILDDWGVGIEDAVGVLLDGSLKVVGGCVCAETCDLNRLVLVWRFRVNCMQQAALTIPPKASAAAAIRIHAPADAIAIGPRRFIFIALD